MKKQNIVSLLLIAIGLILVLTMILVKNMIVEMSAFSLIFVMIGAYAIYKMYREERFTTNLRIVFSVILCSILVIALALEWVNFLNYI